MATISTFLRDHARDFQHRHLKSQPVSVVTRDQRPSRKHAKVRAEVKVHWWCFFVYPEEVGPWTPPKKSVKNDTKSGAALEKFSWVCTDFFLEGIFHKNRVTGTAGKNGSSPFPMRFPKIHHLPTKIPPKFRRQVFFTPRSPVFGTSIGSILICFQRSRFLRVCPIQMTSTKSTSQTVVVWFGHIIFLELSALEMGGR